MLVAIGKLSVPDSTTPVSIYSRLSSAQLRKIAAAAGLAPVHGVQLQTYFTNTGKIWIGDADMNKGTGAGIGHILAPPSTNFYPSWSAALTIGANGLSLSDIYLSVDSVSDTVLLYVLGG